MFKMRKENARGDMHSMPASHLGFMRPVIFILCIFYAVFGIHAGEVWVVKPKAASVWVVSKATAKICPCSSQCVCGCNDGKECDCNKRSTQAIQQPVIQYASPPVLCIGGT